MTNRMEESTQRRKGAKKTLASLRLCALFLIACSAVVRAQPYIDIFSAKAEYFPGHMNSGENPDSLSTASYSAGFLLPLERKNGDVFLFGGNFTTLKFHYTGSVPGDAQLYSVGLAPGYDLLWKNKKWHTLIVALPKINSDMKSGTKDDFQMGGAILFNRVKSDSLKFHFGLYYNREFFGDYFLPLVGIEWKINSHWQLFGDLPTTMTLEYKVSHSFYTGLAFYSVIGSYRLNSGDYVREGDKFWGYEQYKLFFNWYITKHVVWFGEFGHTFGRQYNLYNQNNEELKPLPVFGQDLDGLVFNSGIAYRFRFD